MVAKHLMRDKTFNERTNLVGNQLYYFDSNSKLSPNYTPNYWIPFLSHYYIDTIPFNSEHELFNLNPEIKQTVKTTDFMFMASNCTSTIRNELFLKLSKVNGTISRLEKTVNGSKDAKEVADAKKELVELKKEKAILVDYYKRTNKGEKIPKKKATKKAKEVVAEVETKVKKTTAKKATKTTKK